MPNENINNVDGVELPAEQLDQIAGGALEFRDGHAVCRKCGSTNTESSGLYGARGKLYTCKDCGAVNLDYRPFG